MFKRCFTFLLFGFTLVFGSSALAYTLQDYYDARDATSAAQAEVRTLESQLSYQQNDKGGINQDQYQTALRFCRNSGAPADAQQDCVDNAYNEYLDAETQRSNNIEELQSMLMIAEQNLAAAQSYQTEVELDLRRQGLL